ncbi:hypothetical protein HNR65_003352 [Desulfosalsimonas propionicica]|uniref:Uncharacterized protein n=1 Tax=Desulfosalsimonas propionicica TaxID=332175 RepID=A0A7W0HM51_9BACT|nr:hypothetical protein [Desulfosalsimonas propionicica]
MKIVKKKMICSKMDKAAKVKIVQETLNNNEIIWGLLNKNKYLILLY